MFEFTQNNYQTNGKRLVDKVGFRIITNVEEAAINGFSAKQGAIITKIFRPAGSCSGRIIITVVFQFNISVS